MKRDQKVKMLDGDIWVYGFITIPDGIFLDTCKVLFEFPDTGLDYYYYNKKDLFEVTEEEYQKAKREYYNEP